jgi:hypothetical protein
MREVACILCYSDPGLPMNWGTVYAGGVQVPAGPMRSGAALQISLHARITSA